MIEFKVIATADRTQQLNYQHFGSELTIGNDQSQMILDDPQIGSVQIRIFIEGDQAYIENLMPEVEVRLNGRPIDGSSPIKEKDNITMGRSTINFYRLDRSLPQPPPRYEHPNASERFIPDSTDSAILEALEFLANPHADHMPPPPPISKINRSPPPLPGKPPIPPLFKK